MPRTIEQVDAFMRDPANRLRHQGLPWHNRCEQFVNNAGNFTESFDNALLAGNASGHLDPDLSTITDGSIGFWRGVWLYDKVLKRYVECGHTAFWYRNRWEMASDAVTTMIGNGSGTISAADYERLRPAAIWRGHTKRHGTETLAHSPKPKPKPVIPKPAPAGASVTPLIPAHAEEEEDPMASLVSFVKGDSKKDGYKDAVFRIDNIRLTRRYLPYHGVIAGLPKGNAEIVTISQASLDAIPWDDGPAGKAATEWKAAETAILARK